MKKIVGYKQIDKGIFEEIYEEIPDKLSNMSTEEISFKKALETLINKYSQENTSDTPDFILAEYMQSCLSAYEVAVTRRDEWFGVDMWTEDKRKHTPPNDTISRVIEDLKKESDGI